MRAAVARTLPPGLEQIEVEYQFEQDLPAISADLEQLDQIFDRLILNAIQAMLPPYARQPGGKLVIRAAALDPTSPNPRMILAMLYRQQGRGEEAERITRGLAPEGG